MKGAWGYTGVVTGHDHGMTVGDGTGLTVVGWHAQHGNGRRSPRHGQREDGNIERQREEGGTERLAVHGGEKERGLAERTFGGFGSVSPAQSTWNSLLPARAQDQARRCRVSTWVSRTRSWSLPSHSPGPRRGLGAPPPLAPPVTRLASFGDGSPRGRRWRGRCRPWMRWQWWTGGGCEQWNREDLGGFRSPEMMVEVVHVEATAASHKEA